MIEFRSNSEQDYQVDSERITTYLQEIKTDPMGGWFALPQVNRHDELQKIKSCSKEIQSTSKFLVCIGIGGSYLGHRALIEALHPDSRTKILYAGSSLSSRELINVLNVLGDADFSINIISKSGTTIEPAIAFRILKEKLIQKYGDNYHKRIYATTDSQKGALYEEAVSCGYNRFIVPDNIGGRYSVLSSVGLLPLAVAGIEIDELLAGADLEFQQVIEQQNSPEKLPAAEYATFRHQLLEQNFDVEVLASFEPSLCYFAEWWKQLFGESEGKHRQGIFPAATTYTTDLHSLGQYLQEGRRNIFETILNFQISSLQERELRIPHLSSNLDGLQYLEGRTLDEINRVAMKATIQAHRDGGIPVDELIIPDFSTKSFGALVYFFELSCALSAKLSNINPFDQPGVEAYKKNMFRLLGKPGF